MDEVCVRVWGVEGAGEDVEEGDAVAGGEPVGDGEGEGKGSVIAVRREHENVQGEGCSGGKALLVWYRAREVVSGRKIDDGFSDAAGRVWG